MSIPYDRSAALSKIQEIQGAAEQAIQQAFREKTMEKMIQVYEAGVEEGLSRAPSQSAYDATCKALDHWRAEARRLAKKHGDVAIHVNGTPDV